MRQEALNSLGYCMCTLGHANCLDVGTAAFQLMLLPHRLNESMAHCSSSSIVAVITLNAWCCCAIPATLTHSGTPDNIQCDHNNLLQHQQTQVHPLTLCPHCSYHCMTVVQCLCSTSNSGVFCHPILQWV